jgi:NodT family efflux transporter outer membrane factor (OMF) lipoprotein
VNTHTHNTRCYVPRKIKICALAIASIILLGGCTTPANYQAKSLQEASEFHYSQAFKELQEINWPNDTWWTRYQDSQLNHLVAEAIHDSPTMQMAQARLKNAQGVAVQVGALSKVQVGASADASLTKVSYAYQAYMAPENWNDYGSVTLNFSYDFDFWGKNRAAIDASVSQLAAAQAEEAATKLMLSTSVANAYAELARLFANQDTVKAALSVRKQTVALLTQRYDSGLETKGAVSRAQSAAASVEAELLAVNESIALQKNALAAWLGKGPDRGLTIQRPTIVLSNQFGLPSDAGIGLLGHRPDVTAARWRAQASASRITNAQAQFYPDVRLSAFVGYQAFGLDNLFNEGNDAGSVGPAIYLPLFSGGRLEGQLTSAEANYEEAVSGYNATLTQALHEIADVVTSTNALDARIDKTQQAVAAAREAHQIASNRYKGGLATYLEVLTAEDALLNNERALVNLESRAFSLDLALVHALGGGYEAPLMVTSQAVPILASE